MGLADLEVAPVRDGRDARRKWAGQELTPIGRPAGIQKGRVTRRLAAGCRSQRGFGKIEGDGARRRARNLGKVEHRPNGARDLAIQRQENPDRVFARKTRGHKGEGHEFPMRLVIEPPRRG